MAILFSEEKERSKRFMLSLKIAFPLVLVLITLIYTIVSKDVYEWQDTVLLIILIVCYVYYIVYLIYFGFKNTIIDQVSGAFIRKEITKLIDNELQKESDKNIVLITITNIQDINLRYGYKNGDRLLKKFVISLFDYFEKNGFKDLPIGRYSGGNFIFIVDSKTTHLSHILRTFERKLSNDGIDNIEVKVKFANIEANFDKNIENIMNYMFSKILYDEGDIIKTDTIKPDVLDNLVCYAIDSSDFEIKSQTIKSLKNDKDMLNLSVFINSPEVGNITKIRVMEIAARNNYEIRYDLQIIKFIAKNFDFSSFDGKIFIEILPVSLRNQDFKNEVYRLITNGIIDPKRIVFEIYEREIYDEMLRFTEIVNQFKSYGFEIAINQFLGNNASFEYFKHIDFDYIIYDLELNKNFSSQNRVRTLFDIINENSHKLNTKTIVRFVDKAKFYDELTKTNVDYIQGFYIDKPTKIEI